MNKTALITGASVGIGFELSKIFARNGYNLVLVSRTQKKLKANAKELESKHGIQAKVISKDLSQSTAPQELYDEIVAGGIEITVLVNNAGFGLNGKFVDINKDKQMELIQLNITSLTILSKLFGADMVKRRSGQILNVASTAAFLAGPFMSTYYASKAYVLLFSEGIRNEFAKYGVDVSALCPGPTHTEFGERAEMNHTKLLNVPWVMTAAEVAEIGFAGLMNKKKVIIPGIMNKILAFSTRLTPRSLLVLITRYLNQ
ncbi:SDR family oxidoreductase [Desulfobacula sp.]|uniref:SDR family NAD(P)-dependent oxidoreductase n=1 Tax=Desulfobacula sp. TaxID=2593537 RepID=UPI00262A21C7|nr:SDR family oxidoreductase [Desulfobacula sp.]